MHDPLVKPKWRELLNAVIAAEPRAKAMVRTLIRIGARNMRPDVFGGEIDPGAWFADCRNGLFVGLIRRSDGTWDLNS